MKSSKMSDGRNGAMVSIIVPVFNAEKCIARCLHGLVSQSYKNLEIIVIDDGSCDATWKILSDCMKDDFRIKTLKQEHGGQNAARKKGVEVATGKYVMFVDADDVLLDGAVEKLVLKMMNSDVDVIRFGARYSDGSGRVFPILNDGTSEEVITHGEIVRLLVGSCKLNSLWSHFYKAELFVGVGAFDLDISYGEDFLVNLEVLNRAKKMLVLDDVFYEYNVCVDKSVTRDVAVDRKRRNALDRICVSCRAIEYIEQNIENEANKYLAIYYQLKMIKWSLVDLAKNKSYGLKDFKLDFADVFDKVKALGIDEAKLIKYVHWMSFGEKVKNRGFVRMIVRADYEMVWAYLVLARIMKRGR